jgi:hypothetical protein
LRQANSLRILFKLIIMSGQIHLVAARQFVCNNFNRRFSKNHVAISAIFVKILAICTCVALVLKTTAVGSDTLLQHASFFDDATTDHMPTQLLTDCPIKRDTALENQVGRVVC